MKYREVEFKFSAENISLKDFAKFCKDREPVGYVEAAGYDHFYDSVKSTDSFCRHRIGPDTNQMTFKRKTNDANNQIRTEHNMDLEPHVTVDQVKALCGEFGYKHNFSLYKLCFIYFYDCYSLVYYVTLDMNMTEQGRFIEIEAKENHPWVSEQEAWDTIAAVERICKPLGISPQARVKRSLFEMFKK